jgi:hypothetical protein
MLRQEGELVSKSPYGLGKNLYLIYKYNYKGI